MSDAFRNFLGRIGLVVDGNGGLTLPNLTVTTMLINQGVSVNAPINVTTSTLVLTDALHSGRIVTINRAAGCAMTLPAATGSGATFTIIVGTTITSIGLTVKVANVSDAMIGNQFSISDNSAAVLGYVAAANSDDTITFNGTTQGGYAGDIIQIRDVATNQFQVLIHNKATGTEATCFSATV